MNFDYIELTEDECAWLRQLADAPKGLPSGPNEKNLMEYRFITRNWYHVQSEDGDRKMEPISVITHERQNVCKLSIILKAESAEESPTRLADSTLFRCLRCASL